MKPKLKLSRQWWLDAAAREANLAVGAGRPLAYPDMRIPENLRVSKKTKGAKVAKGSKQLKRAHRKVA